jgi:hypothetical protein
MSFKGFVVNKFLKIVSNTTAALSSLLTTNGEIAHDSDKDKLIIRSNGINDPIVSEARAATLTGKTIDADSNTISNIENADIKAGAAIDASKIADGSVSNTEFQYLGGVTSDIQGQIDAIDSDATQTLTNKTIDGDDNIITDLSLSSLKTNLTDADKFLVRDASGIVVSNTKAVPAGDVVGTSDGQSLSNKTISGGSITSADIDGSTASNTSRLTLPQASKAVLDGLTRKEGTLLYANDQDTLYIDTGASLSPIGGNFVAYAPEALSGGGTVSISLVIGLQYRRVSGSGGPVTLSAQPFGSSAPADATMIRLIGQSDSDTVSLVSSDSAKGCLLNGNITLGLGQAIDLAYDATLDRYIEVSRNSF